MEQNDWTMSEINKDLIALQQQIDKQQRELKQLEKLNELFPDLKKYVGRWNKIVYTSKLVNEKASKYEARYNCGCCNDSPLEIWIYMETENGRVYTDPPLFSIGTKNPSRYYGDYDADENIIDYGWEERLRKNGINESIIKSIKNVYDNKVEDEEYYKDYYETTQNEMSPMDEVLINEGKNV